MTDRKDSEYIYAISSELPDSGGRKAVVEPGRAHYSYRSVRDKFCDMLNDVGESWVDVLHPEIYRDFNLAPTVFKHFTGKKVHISFKPTQYLRAAGGFTNVAHIAWEFERLRSKYTTQPVLPANDDLRMLSAFDQVWVGCEFTKTVLEKHGLKKVFTVPAPIKIPAENILLRTQGARLTRLDQIKKLAIKCFPLSVRNHGFLYAQHSTNKTPRELSRVVQQVVTHGGKAYLQILNPHDSRKNLKKLVKAFHAFHYKNPNTVLILKFTSPEKNEAVYEILRWFLDDSHALDAEGVYFTTDYIPEAIKSEFMSVFDFYLSPSRAEGQNLPLQEAMACGLVPITTKNTAMLDYVSEDNSILIKSKLREITHLDTADHSIWGFEWHDCTELDIYKALCSSLSTASEDLDSKRAAGRAVINEKYSYPAVHKLMSAALQSEANNHE